MVRKLVWVGLLVAGCGDAPPADIDASPVPGDAPADAADAPTDAPPVITVHLTGPGAGFTRDADSGGYRCAAGTCVFPYGAPLTIAGVAVGGSTFAGWSGACTGTGPCVIDQPGLEVTARFEVGDADWTLMLDVGQRAYGLAALSDGIVIAGVQDDSAWLQLRNLDGSVRENRVGGPGGAFLVAVLPGDELVVAARVVEGPALQRHTAAGATVWSTPIPDAVGITSLALDAAGNSYVLLVTPAGRHAVASYTPAGGLRWRFPAEALTRTHRLAVRGDRLAVAGASHPRGQLDVYDLDGNHLWRRYEDPLPSAIAQLELADVAFTAGGDLVFVGMDQVTIPYRMRFRRIAGDNTDVRWSGEDELLAGARLAIASDDHTFFAYQDGVTSDDGRLIERDPAGGVVWSARTSAAIPTARPVVGPDGALYLLYQTPLPNRYALERRLRD